MHGSFTDTISPIAALPLCFRELPISAALCPTLMADVDSVGCTRRKLSNKCVSVRRSSSVVIWTKEALY